MTDVLTEGVAWLNEQRRTHASRSVTYTRPATSDEDDPQTLALAATPAQRFSRIDGEEVPIASDERDWIVSAADLVLGALTTPRRGDTITDGAQVYAVMATDGEKCWRPSDPMGLAIRIHTKLQGNA